MPCPPMGLGCALAALSAHAHAAVIDRSTKVDDTTIYYKVVLPNNFDPARLTLVCSASAAARRT